MRSGKLAVLATTAVLALTGCAGDPNVAAYVNGSRISQAEVDTLARAIAQTVDTAGAEGTLRPVVLSILVQTKVAEVVAKEQKIEVTEAERQSVLASNPGLASLAQNPATADFILRYLNAGLVLSSDKGSVAADEVYARTPVRLNPRLGTWDAEAHAVAEGSSGSLSELAPLKQG